jgi:hypothetical protein
LHASQKSSADTNASVFASREKETNTRQRESHSDQARSGASECGDLVAAHCQLEGSG